MEKIGAKVHNTNIDISKHKRISVKKVLIAVGIIVVLIAAFFAVKAITGKAVISGRTIEYTIKLENGIVISENVSNFTSGKFASSFGLISESLDDSINQLSKGQSTSITLDAEDAFGKYDKSLVIVQNRTQVIPRVSEINRTIEVPLEQIKEAFGEDPVEGKTYNITGAPFSYKILKIKEDVVTLSQEIEVGALIPVDEAVFASITAVSDDKIKILYSTEEQTIDSALGNISVTVDDDNIYFTTNPVLGRIDAYRITILSFNETSIVIDTNIPYAGEKIIVEAKVIDVIEKKITKTSVKPAPKIEGAPTLEVFVMSYCPYGTQMEKGVIPAMKLLNGKANFEIRFVYYTMHGEKEDTENARQVCLREEQPAKFWDYLECFLDAGDAEGCVSDAGIDENKLSGCMSSRVADYLAVDNDLNTQYGVQGSPTTVLNGEVIEISRSPEDVKKAVCAAFENPPAECDETLDSETPSAGFGYTASSSSSAASCGA
jgi:FKBP-type peptidyl-prolyl cis-trans isomerase 2